MQPLNKPKVCSRLLIVGADSVIAVRDFVEVSRGYDHKDRLVS
jgi:hypothetical protein